MFYHKSDLIYSYQWETYDDDPKLRGEPDHSLFNRHQGWEVLYLINKLGEAYHIELKSAGNKMERMIREHLPSNIRSQVNVKQWIRDHWNQY